MRLLLDEMYPPDIAVDLRRKGHDVVAVAEHADLREQEDEDLLRAASAEQRVLLTENVKHFRPIAERLQGLGTAYSGLLFTSARSFPRARSRLRPLLLALDRYLAEHPEEDALEDSWDWLPSIE